MANENFTSNPGAPALSRWWRVVGGMSMNLALGTLYAWSVFVAPLEKEFGWWDLDHDGGYKFKCTTALQRRRSSS